MRLRDPLARTHARRLHTIRLRGQSHPLPPVHYSHHATKTTPAKLRFLPFLPKSNPHHHFDRASAYRFSFTSSFLPLFFLHRCPSLLRNEILISIPLLPSLLSPPRNSTLYRHSKERSLVSKKFLKKSAFSGKIGNQ